MAHATSTNVRIDQACETTRATEFAVSPLADSAAAENHIKRTGETASTNLFEAPFALITARVLEMVVGSAREAT